jgi:hypothetical protein
VTEQTVSSGATRALWPWLGLAALILGYLATWAVQFAYSTDDLKAGGETLLAALDTDANETLWRVTSGLGYISVACLLAFAAGLRRLLERRASGDSVLPSIIFASFLVAAGAMVIAWSFRAQVFDGIEEYAADPSAHVAVTRLSQDTGLAVWAGLLAATAASAVGGLRRGLLPAWLGWLSAFVTIVTVPALLVGLPFPTNIPIGLWLLALILWAIRTDWAGDRRENLSTPGRSGATPG